MPKLSARQTIRGEPPPDRQWLASCAGNANAGGATFGSVALESLRPSTRVLASADYRRDLQRLSVVTVPSEPGGPSVGRVERWW